MIYIKNGNEYPRYAGDIQVENPSWEFGQALPAGWESVAETEQPVASSGVIVKESLPALVDGQWVQSWETVQLTQAEIDGLASRSEEIASKFLPISRQL